MLHMQKALDDIEEMFDRVDENGDRRISFDEFASLMLDMDHTRSAGDLHASFDKIDTNHDGWVDFEEFRIWCS